MQLATALAPIEDDIDYPDTDGEPMAESDFQRDPLTYLVEALKYYFKDNSNVYVSGDLLIYYEEGNPKASVAPDVFVVFGVPKHQRGIYKTWEEGKIPDVVIEITSHTTRKKDQVDKAKLYQRLGVQEYFQYDPTGDYLRPALHGQMLDENGNYQEMSLERMENGALGLTSFRMGLQLRLENGILRMFDPKHKEYRVTYSEEIEARKMAEKQTKLEQQRRRWAQQQAKLSQLEAEQAQIEAEKAQIQAEQERQQKELAHAKAEKLAQRLRTLGINPDEID